MPLSDGGFAPCDNAQTSADLETMLIVGHHLSQQPNDKQELDPVLEEFKVLPESLVTVDALLADNVESCQEEKNLLFISAHRDKHNQDIKERFSDPAPLAEDADVVAAMKHWRQTQDGRALYAKRKCTVESVFIIKAVMGFRQFLLRGMKSVRGEWNLVRMDWNLKR